MTYAAVIKH